MRRLLVYIKPYQGVALWSMLLVLGSVGVDLMVPRLLARVIDQGIARRDMSVVLSTAGMMILAATISAVLAVANTTLSVRVAQSFGHDVRSALYRQVQGLSFGNLDRLQTGQLLVRLTSDVTMTQTLIQLALRMFIRAPLMIVGSIVAMTLTNRQLATVLVVLLPITGCVVWLFTTRLQPAFQEVQLRLDRLNTVLQENLAGVRVVKAFVREDHEGQRFDRTNVALADQSAQVAQLMTLFFPLVMLIMNSGMVAVVWYGGRLVVGGNMSTGSIVAFVNYFLSTMFPLLLLGMTIGQFAAAGASADRILEVLDSRADVQEQPDAIDLKHVVGRVAFEGVSFCYSGEGSAMVLNDVNLVAEPGQTVAILGATGSGKSSLVNLIPRFYDVCGGRVTIDGVDVRSVTLESLRSHVAAVLQEAVLFSGTVRDNIRYGRPAADDQEVVAAAQAAQAHGFISTFPEGYDTMVGQRGVTLSGGQKQRIAIARALLMHPPILILDDSTSSVDVDTEAQIQEALEGLRKVSTSFVVAQRISTVLNADKIVVLDQGTIAAQGTHAELMDSSSIYREIYDSQLGDGGAQNG